MSVHKEPSTKGDAIFETITNDERVWDEVHRYADQGPNGEILHDLLDDGNLSIYQAQMMISAQQISNSLQLIAQVLVHMAGGNDETEITP